MGLSPAQINVYLTLIKTGKTSAKALAERTGVACPDIYRMMNIFENKGLIQKSIESPKKFEAIKIEEALPMLLNNKIEETKELKKDIKRFIREVKKVQKQNEIDPESNLIIFPPTKITLQKRKEKIQNTKFTIDSVISWNCHRSYLNQNMKALTRKAVDRGVKYRLIIENPKKIDLTLKSETFNMLIKNGAEIKYITKKPPAIVSIYDNKEALIYTVDNPGLFDAPLIWTNNNSIVSIVKGYFENLWNIDNIKQSNS